MVVIWYENMKLSIIYVDNEREDQNINCATWLAILSDDSGRTQKVFSQNQEQDDQIKLNPTLLVCLQFFSAHSPDINRLSTLLDVTKPAFLKNLGTFLEQHFKR